MDDNMDFYTSDPEDFSGSEPEDLGGVDSFSGEDSSYRDQLDLNSFSTKRTPSETRSARSASGGGNKKKKRKKRKGGFARVFLSIFLVGIITFCFVFGAFAVYVFGFVDNTVHEDLDELKLDFTTTVYVMDSKSGEYVEYQRLHGEKNRIWVSDEKGEIPKYLKDAFVAIEDKRFFDHNGVDWKRTFSAFANLFFHFFSSNQGGSTITQQLVKNLTGDNSESPMRKIREIMRARYLEEHYYKDTILECYLNTIPMAAGLYGVETAANYYFDKHTSELTLAEAASLAAITKNPERYRPDKKPENNVERRNLVLSEMLDQKMISREEYDAAVAEELNVVADPDSLGEKEINSYFIDTLIEEFIDRLVEEYKFDESHAANNFYNGGYKIYCTLDPAIQEAVEKVTTDPRYALKGANGTTMQASITVMDYEGHIVGIAGGLGEKTVDRGLNRATQSPRQPGSTIKPIAAYAPCVENNLITYSSMIQDKKRMFNGNWTPKNWYGGYYGTRTAAYFLQQSSNAIPVYLIDMLTPQASYDFLTQKLGITTLDAAHDIDYAPLGMGGMYHGLTTRESAAAFAIFGNLGKYYKPTTFVKATDHYDNVVFEQEEPIVAIGEDTANVMNHMLQNVVYGSPATGTGARGYIPHMRIFAKTGTSDNTNDLWFVGGSPYYVASCWSGFDDNQRIKSATIAQTIWGKVMSQIHSKLPAKEFPESEYVTCRRYCTSTGLVAKSGCPSTAIGWYKTTYMPVCSTHGGTVLNAVSGSSAGTPTSPGTTSSSSSTSSAAASSSSSKPTSSTAPSSSDPASTAPPVSSEETPSTPETETSTSASTTPSTPDTTTSQE